jgi:hypothetical protein
MKGSVEVGWNRGEKLMFIDLFVVLPGRMSVKDQY